MGGFPTRFAVIIVEFIALGGGDTICQSGRGFVFPRADDEDDERNPQPQSQKWHDPGHAVEASGSRSSDYGGTVVLHESLQDEIVTLGAIESRHQLIPHFVGIRATNVIAFEKNLTASARAHHPVAELVETGGVTGAEEEKDRHNN